MKEERMAGSLAEYVEYVKKLCLRIFCKLHGLCPFKENL